MASLRAGNASEGERRRAIRHGIVGARVRRYRGRRHGPDREIARWRETGEVAYERDFAVGLTLDDERIVRIVVMPAGATLAGQSRFPGGLNAALPFVASCSVSGHRGLLRLVVDGRLEHVFAPSWKLIGVVFSGVRWTALSRPSTADGTRAGADGSVAHNPDRRTHGRTRDAAAPTATQGRGSQ